MFVFIFPGILIQKILHKYDDLSLKQLTFGCKRLSEKRDLNHRTSNNYKDNYIIMITTSCVYSQPSFLNVIGMIFEQFVPFRMHYHGLVRKKGGWCL